MNIFELHKPKHLYLEQEKKKPNLVGDRIMREKLDGWYVEFRWHNGRWSSPYSSSGRLIPSMERFIPKAPALRTSEGKLIAEATIDGVDFHTLNGLFNRSIGNYHLDEVVFNFHDIISDINQIAVEREKVLTNFLPELYLPSQAKRRFIPILGISSYVNIWMQTAEDIWSRDGEGLVVKKVNSVYAPGKKNSDLLKIKLEGSADLQVIGSEWSTGKKGNQAFNLVLKDKSGTTFPAVVARHELIDKFQKKLPEVVEIKFMKKLENGSYREPRFYRERPDKSINQID